MEMLHKLLLESPAVQLKPAWVNCCRLCKKIGSNCRTILIVSALSVVTGILVSSASAASVNVKALSKFDKQQVVDFIRDRRGGCVTVANGGRYETRCGPQDLQYINANTITIDLQIIGVKPKDLAGLLSKSVKTLSGAKAPRREIRSSVDTAIGKSAASDDRTADPATLHTAETEPVAGEHRRGEPLPEQGQARDGTAARTGETLASKDGDEGSSSGFISWAVGLLVLVMAGGFYRLSGKPRNGKVNPLSTGESTRVGSNEREAALVAEVTDEPAGRDQKRHDHDWLQKYGFDHGDYARDVLAADKEGELDHDREGFDEYGYDRDGYNREGRDGWGYDRDGYNKNGYDRYGYDKDGFNGKGYDKSGFDREGYDAAGYNRSGYNRSGAYRSGFGRAVLTKRRLE